MATQHRSQNQNTGEGRGSGHRGPAPGHAFGVASVTQAISGANFPISKAELMREFGDEEIFWTKDKSEVLGDILERVTQDRFQTVAELTSAVSQSHGETDENE